MLLTTPFVPLVGVAPGAFADDSQHKCGKVDCSGSDGAVSAGDSQPGEGSGGGAGDNPAGSGLGDSGPIDTTAQPVVVVHHCGPRIPPSSIANATDANCRVALIGCPLPDGAVADQTLESTETITTSPAGDIIATQIACDVPVATAAAPQVTAADIEQWVIRQLPIGAISTTGARSLVNTKTVLWLNVPKTREWGPLTIIQAGVRIKATLVSVQWNFGDGTTDSSADAGRPYDKLQPCDAKCDAYYGHAYRGLTGPVFIHAQAFWRAEFSVDGGPFTALAAPVAANLAAPLQVTIVQAHSKLVAAA